MGNLPKSPVEGVMTLSERRMRRIGFGLTIAVVASAIWILNGGPIPAGTATSASAAAECPSGGGGGGGGGSPTPTSSGSSQPSPSGSSAGELVNAPLPVQSSGSPSPSGSSSGGGPLPNLSSILPGGSSSPSSTGSSSPPPSSGGPACPTDVTIKYVRVSQRTSDPRDHFEGKVKSPNSDCVKGRDVTLKKVAKPNPKTVGRTVSQKSGTWKIRGVKPKGRFYAVAKPRKVGDVTCKKGKSKTISP